ncbi:MAG: UxaA family hydrolase [bacterium]
MNFNGYIRPQGKFGIRNHVLILPSSVCASTVAANIAHNVPGCVSAYNAFGCCQVGADAAQSVRTLVNTAANPNVGAVLVVGLGCEGLEPLPIADAIAKFGKPVRMIVIQQEGGSIKAEARGIEIARELAATIAQQEREPIDIAELILGLECGGSDTTSGLAANPALGVTSDMLIKLGGAAMLSETTELIGAEHVLARRAVNAAVKDKLIKIVRDCEERAKSMGVDLRGSQPTPGNIAGGLTSIEEKSLGCIHKAGTSPVQGVLEYAEIQTGKGLYVMDTPGQDILSMSGMAAGGVQVMVFTTGLGTPAGNPIMPVIKVTGNHGTYTRMSDNIDIDLGGIIDGTLTIEEAGQILFDEVLAVANGKLTKAEELGHTEFSIYRIGPTF